MVGSSIRPKGLCSLHPDMSNCEEELCCLTELTNGLHRSTLFEHMHMHNIRRQVLWFWGKYYLHVLFLSFIIWYLTPIIILPFPSVLIWFHWNFQGLDSSPWTPKNMKKSGQRKGAKKKKRKENRTHKKSKNREKTRKTKKKSRALGAKTTSLSLKKLNRYKFKSKIFPLISRK